MGIMFQFVFAFAGSKKDADERISSPSGDRRLYPSQKFNDMLNNTITRQYLRIVKKESENSIVAWA